MFSFASADVNTQVVEPRVDCPFQCTHHTCGDTRRMPVHAHHTPEGLKPHRIAQSQHYSTCPIFHYDRFDDSAAELAHPGCQPGRHRPVVQRKIGVTKVIEMK